MRTIRRCVIGVIALSLLLASTARAQAFKQLPANPLLVIKVNNPEAVSKKVAALAEKMGLSKLIPPLADPLAMVQQELKIKEGFDPKGELVIGIYDSAQGEDEPRIMALIPVSDFKAFMGNMANVKEEGGLATFNFPGDQDPIYGAQWGNYAAISPWKEMLAAKPTGIDVAGVVGKQVAGQDIVMYVNAKHIGKQVLPMLQGARQEIMGEMDRDLARNAPFDKKYIPVIKAVVNQVLNTAEQTLIDASAGSIGLSLSEAGINATVVGEFEPAGYVGKLMASIKNSDQDVSIGLPAGKKYFAFGGFVNDPASAGKLINDLTGPIAAELQKVGPEAKTLSTLLDNFKTMIIATEGGTIAYVAPEGVPGQQSVLQQVFIYRGDAKKIQTAGRQYMSSINELFKLMMPAGQPGQPIGGMNFTIQENAKTVDGAQFDAIEFKMNLDKNTPEGAQVAQMMQMFYGGEGMSGFMGPVNDKTVVGVMGGNDELLTSTVAAVKKGESAIAASAHVKLVADQLPKQKAGAMYIQLDNIATAVLGFMEQFGMKVPLKLPPDMPPLGISWAGEGSALRIYIHISADLIEKAVSAGTQLMMMMQGRPRPPGRL